MSAKYQALSLLQTGGFAPSQWSVGALPKPLYVRYRWGWLTVQEDLGDELGHDLMDKRIGGEFDSIMTAKEMMSHTAELIDWSQCHA